MVDTVSTPMPLNVLQSKKLGAKSLITHRFKLDKVLDVCTKPLAKLPRRELKVIIEV